MCAQIEKHPRQGVELYATCGAPTLLELLICDAVTAVLIGAAVVVAWRFA